MTLPVATLVRQHRLIGEALDAVEGGLYPLRLSRFHDAVVTLRDRFCPHVESEEHALRRAASLPREVVASLIRNHRMEQGYLQEVIALLSVVELEPSFLPALLDAARSTVAWLRDHLWKEEHLVFPLERGVPETGSEFEVVQAAGEA